MLLSPVDTASTTVYTSSLNLESSSLIGVNGSGTVLGQSNQYNGGATAVTAVWTDSVASPTPVFIGLTDTAHTNSLTGYSTNTGKAINANGISIGSATAYLANGTSIGSDVWIYNPGSTATPQTTRIDPATLNTAANYSFASTSATGNRGSTLIALNDSGLVAGTSSIYSGTSNIGTVGWFFNDTTGALTQVGVTPQSIGANNRASTSVNGLSQSGIVIGQSTRYVSTTSTATIGSDAWYYDTTAASPTTTTIGLAGNAWNTNTATYSYSSSLNTYSSTTYPNLAYSFTSSGNTTQFSSAASSAPTV